MDAVMCKTDQVYHLKFLKMMKKILFLLGLGLLLTNAVAQDANSLLWKVQSPEGQSSYVFGTYHLVNSGFLEKNPRVKQAYGQSQRVVVETLIDSTKMLQMAMAMMMQEKTLRDLLDSNEYHLVDSVLQKSMGMGLAMFNTLKPMAVSTMYAASLAEQNLPEELKFEGQPMDLYFAAEGQKTGKEVVALETMMEQAEMLFDSQSLEEQADALVQVVDDQQEAVRMTVALIEAYRKEELGRMRDLADEEGADYGDMAVLLQERNANWIPKLEEVLKKGNAFIAVGALHLTGDDGILHLLREKGYRVEPVMP